MNDRNKYLSRWKNSLFSIGLVLCLLIMLLLITRQSSARFGHTVPAAGNRAARVDYYVINCPRDNRQTLQRVVPLPPTRYLYSDAYGWFDTSHFNTGNPAQLITKLETIIKKGNKSIISISQPVRGGVTGYKAHYLVFEELRSEDVLGVALGIYLDWSTRFEAWQGQMPRSLVGPLTPFSIEDLPTQYVGFVAATSNLEIEELFACYLGEVKSAEGPPHIWITHKRPGDDVNFPIIERLTNRGFEPLVLTKKGWQIVHWPIPLRLEPIGSSKHTWVFMGEETWYLGQDGSVKVTDMAEYGR